MKKFLHKYYLYSESLKTNTFSSFSELIFKALSRSAHNIYYRKDNNIILVVEETLWILKENDTQSIKEENIILTKHNSFFCMSGKRKLQHFMIRKSFTELILEINYFFFLKRIKDVPGVAMFDSYSENRLFHKTNILQLHFDEDKEND